MRVLLKASLDPNRADCSLLLVSVQPFTHKHPRSGFHPHRTYPTHRPPNTPLLVSNSPLALNLNFNPHPLYHSYPLYPLYPTFTALRPSTTLLVSGSPLPHVPPSPHAHHPRFTLPFPPITLRLYPLHPFPHLSPNTNTQLPLFYSKHQYSSSFYPRVCDLTFPHIALYSSTHTTHLSSGSLVTFLFFLEPQITPLAPSELAQRTAPRCSR